MGNERDADTVRPRLTVARLPSLKASWVRLTACVAGGAGAAVVGAAEVGAGVARGAEVGASVTGGAVPGGVEVPGVVPTGGAGAEPRGRPLVAGPEVGT